MYYNPSRIFNYRQPFCFLLGNRGSGKSFSFKNKCVKDFINNGEQFIYSRRYVSDIKRVIENLFDDVMVNYPDHTLTVDKNIIYIDEEVAGYCIAVSEYIKYKSATFEKVTKIVFDEFLPEDNKYLGGKANPNLEPELCLNFYQSVARGYNKPIRDDVMFIFIANSVSVNNPYFYYFNIDKKIHSNTKFIKGEGYCVEINRNESISSEIADSKFGKLIKGSKYESYALGNDFYLDSDEFINKIKGQKNYILTFVFNKNKYGLWRTSTNCYYITELVEPNCKNIFSLDTKDHNENTILVNRVNNLILKDINTSYATGKLYFASQRCKVFFENAILK